MTTNRPNPIALSADLNALIECWLELDRELTRKGGPSSSSGASEHGAPLDLSVLDAKREVDTFAHTYCQMLSEETEWKPSALNTPDLLRGIILRIGHFTEHDDALIAYEFASDLEEVSRSAWRVARPDGMAHIPVGACFQEGCKGSVRVTIDRDRPMDAASLATWRPTATCDVNDAHKIDARLYANGSR